MTSSPGGRGEGALDKVKSPSSTTVGDIWEQEKRWVDARRTYLKTNGSPKPCERSERRVGLALSGGGIRSATFSLGILQALSSGRHMSSIDYLSTVSGGSYIGSFFGALFIDPVQRGGEPLKKTDLDKFLADPLGGDRGRAAVANLREFGRYLTPGGWADVMFGASLVARNWLLVQLVLGLLPLALFFLLRGLPAFFGGPKLMASGSAYLLAGAAATWIVGMGLAFGYWFTRKEQTIQSRFGRALSAPLLVTVAATAIGWASLRDRPAAVGLLLIATAAIVTYLVVLIGFGKSKPIESGGAELTKLGQDFAVRQAEDHVRAKLTRWLATANSGCIALLTIGLINLLGEEMANTMRQAAVGWAAIVEDFRNDNYLWSTIAVAVEHFWPLLVVMLPFGVTIWGHRALRHGTGSGWLSRSSGQTTLGFAIVMLWLTVWSMVASLVVGPLEVGPAAPREFGFLAHIGISDPRDVGRFLAVGFAAVAGIGLFVLGPLRSSKVLLAAVVTALVGLGLAIADFDWITDLVAAKDLARMQTAMLFGLLGLVGVLLLCFMYGFANLSSLVTLYSARLKRAYVGASVPRTDRGIDVDHAGDLVPMQTYYGFAPQEEEAKAKEGPLPDPSKSAVARPIQQDEANVEAKAKEGPLPHPDTLAVARPIHLINATVAQTVPEGKSNVVAYDRKGKPLHVSPVGIVAGQDIGGQVECYAHDSCESLALSDWTAISGAAASTAVGSRSSLGLSVLAMMTNVRLGYWWKPVALKAWPLPLSWRDTMIGYLVSEFFMNFDTSLKAKRRWYLTDGGHFDNTGAYPLLQRQLDFIIVCDNGADPDYACDDLVRLMQIARTDLDTDIEFLEKDKLDGLIGASGELRKAIGEYNQIARVPDEPEPDKAGDGPYAALAKVTYRRSAPSSGYLLLIKPKLNFTEPPELLAYRRRDAGRAFPQQTTLDQFFDEDQWEAYRHFGEVVGRRLFGQTGGSAGETVWLPDTIFRSQGGPAE